MRTSTEIREAALDVALAVWERRKAAPVEEFFSIAERAVQFLAAPTVVRIRVGLIRKQDGTHPREQEGSTMQLRDNEQVDYTIDSLDAKGYEVAGESFTCTVDDESVVTVTQDGSTFTAVAGNPGSTVLTFSDGTVSATEAIDVVPGEVATITVTPGAVTKQA